VYNIMFPVYGTTYYCLPDQTDGKYWVIYNLMQTQTYGPRVFDMPIDMRFYSGGHVIFDTTVFNDSNDQLYLFKTSSAPDSIVVDPDNWILNKKFPIEWKFRILPLPMRTGYQAIPYLDTILYYGGSGHNHFQIISGSLPDGLTMNTITGIISGTPIEQGDFTFTVSLDDDYSPYYDECEFTLSVTEAIEIPGDANNDMHIDILDIVYLINYKYKDGPVPVSPQLSDPNADCRIDILDIVYLLNFKYKNGPSPFMGCASY